MSQLIDLCGTPIQLDKIRDFRLVKRECLYYPAYQETETQGFSLFARFGAENKKKFKFVQMVPFGILLSDKEKPSPGSYEIKSFGEAEATKVLADLRKALCNAANIAADLLRIDTSGNKEFHILTAGRRITDIKLRDIPAKVSFLSGKVSDVYKNDSIYEFLGEPISPTVVTIPTLVVTVEKATHVFFGGGIDLADAESAYHALFEAYNQYQADKAKKKNTASFPAFNLPKLDLTAITLQLPFGKGKGTEPESEAPAMLPASSSLSANDEAAHALDSNDQQAT